VEEIAELYSNTDSSAGKMLTYITRFTQTDTDIATTVWAYAFLTAIVKSETSTKGKLDEVASP
jgi:hypothetical protein